jgi:adenosine kinase
MTAAGNKDGVNVQYYVTEEHPTGTCAVLVCDKDRSLVTNLGAANHFKIEHLQKPEMGALVEAAKVFYVSGFFLTVSPPSAVHIAQHACDNNKVFMLSLSAPFICDFFSDPLKELLPFADYIVGNEHEAMAFGKKWGFGEKIEDLPEIAKKISHLAKKNDKRPRTVIFTQGADETIIVTGDNVQRFPVIPCAKEAIVDLNGAGDAWLGGFLAYLVQEAPVEKCVAAANYAANIVIQRQGCSYPDKPDFK